MSDEETPIPIAPAESGRREDDDRRGDPVARTRLDDIAHQYELWSKRTLVILSVLVVFMILGGLVSGYLYWRIQQSRENACLAVNERHDNAIEKLNIILDAAVEKGTLPKANRQDVFDQNKLLVEALAPKRNCDNF
jgi:uncharacterized protein HemX